MIARAAPPLAWTVVVRPLLSLHPTLAEGRAEPRVRKLIDGMGLKVRPLDYLDLTN